jgi:hypothetical protein
MDPEPEGVEEEEEDRKEEEEEEAIKTASSFRLFFLSLSLFFDCENNQEC